MTYNEDYYRTHKQQLIDAAVQWNKDNPAKFAKSMRKGHYRRKYSQTVDDYDLMYVMQDGQCAVCGRTDNYTYNHLSIDHDHHTGEARGLLCVWCNMLVGLVEHLHITDEILLEKVERYLSGKAELGFSIYFSKNMKKKT